MTRLSPLLSEEWWNRFQEIIPPIKSIEDFLERDPFLITTQLNCSLNEIIHLKQYISLQVLGFEPSFETQSFTLDNLPSYSLSSPPLPSLNTGFEQLNHILGGGLPLSQIIGLFGEGSSGKTSLCMKLALVASYQGHRVLFLDTSNAFSIEKFNSYYDMLLIEEQIATSSQFTMTEKLQHKMELTSRIFVHPCYDFFEMLSLLEQLINQHTPQDIPQKQHRPTPKTSSSSSTSSLASLPQYDLIIIDGLHALIAPYLMDHLGEKIPPNITTMTTISSMQTSQLIGNIHPLLSQLAILMKALISQTNISMIVTNVWHQESLISRSTTLTTASATFASTSTGNSMPTNIHSIPCTGGMGHWRDIFDYILKISPITSPSTAISSEINEYSQPNSSKHNEITNNNNNGSYLIQSLHRPPYLKNRTNQATVNFNLF